MFDVSKMMQQAQNFQQELANIKAEGKSGGGIVKIEIDGNGNLISIDIDESLMKQDEVNILQDLIIAAHLDAKNQLQELIRKKMTEMTGGMNIPKTMFPGI